MVFIFFQKVSKILKYIKNNKIEIIFKIDLLKQLMRKVISQSGKKIYVYGQNIEGFRILGQKGFRILFIRSVIFM